MVITTMNHVPAVLWLLGSLLHALIQCTIPASEFQLKGDFMIGGLFDIHHVHERIYQDRPQVIICSSKTLILSSYRRFQLMRFTVEEINNSTTLLPNVSLGYDAFDQCSDTHNFAGLLKLISVDGGIQPWDDQQKNLSKVSKLIGVVGPFSSTDTWAVAPLFMMNLIPLVSFGAASSAFSRKEKFPSFLRTAHPNTDVIEVIVTIVQQFDWRWVAFLNSADDDGEDGLELFRKRIKDINLCLAYTNHINAKTNYSQMFEEMEEFKIITIIAFVSKQNAEALIESAIRLNITNKVWIATDSWSLNERLPKLEGIRNIGTVLGVSQPVVTIPGFDDFIYSFKEQTQFENAEQKVTCNQFCNCSSLSAEDILSKDPTFSLAVYSAVYAIAHALHNVLQCGAGRCNRNITVYQHMVLAELKKSNFTLLNENIGFDKFGNPNFGSYSIVFWNQRGHAEDIGYYEFYPSSHYFINSTKIQWHGDKEVPSSRCSPDCPVGFAQKHNGKRKCCFKCERCPSGTYVNITDDPFRCMDCKETEWSAAGSTYCSLRLVEYIPYSDSVAILIMLGACVLVALTVAMSVLFAINYNTPVVKSAGGPMCFLILSCISLCSISVFFYFDKPTTYSCILRFLPFLLFYSVCLACFVVRSFQIVCVFKMAAKFPKLHSLWMKYHGQWLLITVAFVTQAVVLLFTYTFTTPKPYNETVWYPDKIVLGCDDNLKLSSLMLLLFLCSLCFIFSYMGKDLPKNYNEAKAITFCLLLLILTWIVFATVNVLYRGKNIQTLNALAVLSSLFSFLLWYFLPKCYIIIFQPERNTQQYFQGLIQNYTMTVS